MSPEHRPAFSTTSRYFRDPAIPSAETWACPVSSGTLRSDRFDHSFQLPPRVFLIQVWCYSSPCLSVYETGQSGFDHFPLLWLEGEETDSVLTRRDVSYWTRQSLILILLITHS